MVETPEQGKNIANHKFQKTHVLIFYPFHLPFQNIATTQIS